MSDSSLTRLDRCLAWWGEFLLSHAGWVLIAAAVLTLFAIPGALKFRIEWGEDILLPSGRSSPGERASLASRVGGVGFLIAIVEGGDFDNRRRFIDEWVRRLNEDQEIRRRNGGEDYLRYALYKLPLTFFEDRRLLYLEPSDLEDIENRLIRRLDQERTKKNPFYVDLEMEEEPEVDISFGDLQKKYNVHRFREYYSSPDDRILAVLFKPARSISDLDFAHRFMAWVRDTADAMAARGDYAGVTVSLGGPVAEMIEGRHAVRQDIVTAMAVLALGYSLMALLVFRRFRPLVLLWASSGMALAWLLACFSRAVGSVSLLSAFAIPATLALGLGWGLVFFRKYLTYRIRDNSREEALLKAIAYEGRIVFLSGLAAIAASLALLRFGVNDYAHFGLLAAGGMVSMMLAVLVVLPAIIAVVERVSLMVVIGAVPLIQSMVWRIPRGRAIVLGGLATCAMGVALLFVSLRCLMQPWCSETERCCEDKPCCWTPEEFEYNFQRFTAPEMKTDKVREKLSAIVPVSYNPLVVLTDSRPELQSFLADLRKLEKDPASGVAGVGSIFTFVPTDQSEKLKIMARIDQLATEENIGFLEQRVRRRIEETRYLLHPPEISIYQLPLSVIRAFSQEPPGTHRLTEILESALSRLPATINESEWRQAVSGVVNTLPIGEVAAALGAARAHQDLARAAKAASEPRGKLVDVLKRYHDVYLGTVAYVYPELDPLYGRYSMGLAKRIDALMEKHSGVRVMGLPFDLADTLRSVEDRWAQAMALAIFAPLVLLLLCLRRPLIGWTTALVPVAALCLLLIGMAGFQIKWNLYNLLAVPIAIGIGVDAALRIYLRYWEENQIGAVQTILMSAPSLLMMLLTLLLGFVGSIFAEHRGMASLAAVLLVGLLFAMAAAVVFYPALLQTIHLRLQRR
ncbi:MAG: hypothetical protein C4523_04360 [Myxococcales bacterium]|nr:MAG: hypothetical protein C4523_04360 [Myxococcales bacterium]